MNTPLPPTFDRALADLGLSGPVYRVDEAGDGALTLHLPTGVFTWRPGDSPSPSPPRHSERSEESDFTAISGINAEIAAALHNAGFHTFDDLVRASDPALLDIAGIGPATLRRIRAYLKDHYL